MKGRFEKIGKIKNNSKVILDYAHTPEALKTCLLNLREQFKIKKFLYFLDVVEIEIKIKDLKWVKLHLNTLIKFILQMIIQDMKIQKKFEEILKKGLKNKILLKYLIDLKRYLAIEKSKFR